MGVVRAHTLAVFRLTGDHLLDTVLQTSLVPVDTKTEDGFCTTPQTCLSSSYTDTIRKHVGSSVDSPNHYTLAQSGVLYDCPDDITGQLYTSPLATLVGTDAVVSYWPMTCDHVG